MQPERDPDIAWVAHLGGAELGAAKRVVSQAQAERRLYAHLAGQHAREGRRSYIEIGAPLELYGLARLLEPQHVVEIGVASGVSSAYLLSALERNGRGLLHSIDRPKYDRPTATGAGRTTASWSIPAGRSPGWAVPPRLWSRWDLRIGDKRAALPILTDQIARIDLFVYDVPHSCDTSWEEFRALDRRIPPGAVVIVDHGPGGGLCPALAHWAEGWKARTVQRAGTGLFGARRPVRSGAPWPRDGPA